MNSNHTTIKTRSTHPFALVAKKAGTWVIVGYAASKSPRVVQRASRLNARIVPIPANGRLEIES